MIYIKSFVHYELKERYIILQRVIKLFTKIEKFFCEHHQKSAAVYAGFYSIYQHFWLLLVCLDTTLFFI